MWMNPPNVYEETTPSSHSTSRITKIVQSIFHLLGNSITDNSFAIQFPTTHFSSCWPLPPAPFDATPVAQVVPFTLGKKDSLRTTGARACASAQQFRRNETSSPVLGTPANNKGITAQGVRVRAACAPRGRNTVLLIIILIILIFGFGYGGYRVGPGWGYYGGGGLSLILTILLILLLLKVI
jgi:hypothetical protein